MLHETTILLYYAMHTMIRTRDHTIRRRLKIVQYFSLMIPYREDIFIRSILTRFQFL